MITRYTRPEMGAIWTDENKYRIWLEIELLATIKQEHLGIVPVGTAKKIREKATFNSAKIDEIERENALLGESWRDCGIDWDSCPASLRHWYFQVSPLHIIPSIANVITANDTDCRTPNIAIGKKATVTNAASVTDIHASVVISIPARAAFLCNLLAARAFGASGQSAPPPYDFI